MNKILYAITALVIFASCKSSKDYLSKVDEDKTLFDIVKKLNKQSNDEAATNALPEVYKQAQERHLKKIATYNSYRDISRWDKIYGEYSILQNMFDAIDNSPAASRQVTPISYQNEIADIKQSAAADYYRLGESYNINNSREDARLAYTAFKKADSWERNFNDSRAKMDEAFNASIVNLVINPVQDNSFFYNTGWGNIGYNYSNEYFQQNLVRDLGGKYAARYPARFYTEREARQEDITPDWVVDLTLRNMDIPRPTVSNHSRNVSKQVEIGKDTAGKPVHKTVYATLNIQRQSFRAHAQMDVNIVAISTRKNIAFNSFNDTYDWQEEIATYSGDKRALSTEEWAMVNNSNFKSPQKEEILNQLYRNIYPRVKNMISKEVDW